MDRREEVFDAMVKRIFGPGALIAGTAGTVKRPGDVRIVVDRRLLGIGTSFSAALQDAQRQVTKDAYANVREGQQPCRRS